MISEAIIGLQCYQCKWMVPPQDFSYTCPRCGKNLDFIYDYERIAASCSPISLNKDHDHSIWRYLPLLPVKNSTENKSLRIGGTPLVSLPALAAKHGLAGLQFKDDSRNPSGSLKDRASEVAIQHALERGQKSMVAASTGNAGSSLAALCAFHGMQSIIFAPATAPPAKLTQILQHGAQLVPVNANYDTAFDLALQYANKHQAYCRNTGINPILAEGKKTVALEIAEQNDWAVPDHVFVPVGDGCIIAGVYKGFYDLLALKWTEFMPALHGVQAEGSAAIVDSLSQSGEIQPVTASTIADSISVDKPRDGDKARRAIIGSGGRGFKVSDDDILKAQKLLSEETGIFAEPAAAAAYAGFLKASEEGIFMPDEHVVVLITGSGLKDTTSAQKLLRPVEAIKAELRDIETYLENSVS